MRTSSILIFSLFAVASVMAGVDFTKEVTLYYNTEFMAQNCLGFEATSEASVTITPVEGESKLEIASKDVLAGQDYTCGSIPVTAYLEQRNADVNVKEFETSVYPLLADEDRSQMMTYNCTVKDDEDDAGYQLALLNGMEAIRMKFHSADETCIFTFNTSKTFSTAGMTLGGAVLEDSTCGDTLKVEGDFKVDLSEILSMSIGTANVTGAKVTIGDKTYDDKLICAFTYYGVSVTISGCQAWSGDASTLPVALPATTEFRLYAWANGQQILNVRNYKSATMTSIETACAMSLGMSMLTLSFAVLAFTLLFGFMI